MCHCTCTRAIRHPPLTADINTYVWSHSLFYRFSTCEKEGSIPYGSFSFTCSSPSQSCQIGDRKKRRGVSLDFSDHFLKIFFLFFRRHGVQLEYLRQLSLFWTFYSSIGDRKAPSRSYQQQSFWIKKTCTHCFWKTRISKARKSRDSSNDSWPFENTASER